MNDVPTIPFSTFASVDIRAGKIQEAVPLEGSDKLYRLSVDLGKEYSTVTILSGLRQWYSPDDLTGHVFLFAVNIEPRTIMGHTSHGMILACDGEDKPILAQMPDDLAPGARIR